MSVNLLANATVSYKSHREDQAHVWFVPCKKAAILFNTTSPNDSVTFKFMKIDKNLYKNYVDPDSCFTYRILLG